MATADIGEEGIIRVRTSYVDRDRMLLVAGSRFDKPDGTWKVPLSWASCLVLRGVFGEDLEISEPLADWARKTRDEHIAPSLALKEAMSLYADHPVSRVLDLIESGSTLKLKPYQRADVAFLIAAGQACLFNEPGLGKTAVMIRNLQSMVKMGLDPFPAIIVCPNSLKVTVWQRELESWAPEITAQVIDGGAATRRKQISSGADCLIINWDLLRYHSRLASYGNEALSDAQKLSKELNKMGQRTVILDEGHRLIDPKSQQTRAAWSVAHEAEYRYVLTGTPVESHAGDLWGILHTVVPDWFPSKTRYLARYAQITWGLFGGMEIMGLKPEHADEFRTVTSPIIRRIPKQAALPDLPDRLPDAYRHTPMTPRQAKAYKQMQDEMAAELNELLVAPDPLAALTRLLQFAAASAETETVECPRCKGSGQYPGDEEGCQSCRGTGKKQLVHLSAPSGKIDDLAELLEELGEEQLVVAAVSRQLILLAAARLDKEKITYCLITGLQDVAERDQAARAFQAGEKRVLLMTLGTGSEGLTLTAASKMLFMQESWRTIENQQACDRIYRIGSEKHDSIQVIKQVTPGTVEEARIQVLSGKQVRIEEVIRDREVLSRLLGRPEDK